MPGSSSKPIIRLRCNRYHAAPPNAVRPANARIVELEYGTGELPPKSFFERMVVEMAAWAKEPVEVLDQGSAGADAEDFAL